MILVKICGITNLADARAASEAGANLLGFNFYEKSLRRVSTVDAANIRAKLPNNVDAVGIFVNAKVADIVSLRAFVRYGSAQLHGDETAAVVKKVAESMPVIKAFRVGADFAMSKFEEYPGAFAFLLDAAQAGQYGGTGRTTDWGFAERAARGRRIILAGGLKVENVAEAIRVVKPYAVDVASGVEAKPGKKDHGKMKEFIEEVRRAERELEAGLSG
ncbi:MAG TPA: phosphoribosylanthranilate isomerase [Candidatus Acidoferrum sp.]|jgi:phosphoribosylanthranilate isomerase